MLAAACGSTDAPGDLADRDAPDEVAGPPAPGAADLPSGVAARIGESTDITVADLQARVALVSEQPEVAEALAEDAGGVLRTQLQAELLAQMIVIEVALVGAAEQGIDVTQADVDASRQELEDEAGGPDAFLEEARRSGIPEDQLGRTLLALVALDEVAATLDGDDGQAGGPDAAVAAWFVDLLGRTPVVVATELGLWDPSAGQVVPPGS